MIFPDDRETERDDGVEIIHRLGNPPTMWLDHADYLIHGNNITALVECFTPLGLLQDIASGRAVEKLEGAAGDADLVILMLSGLILPADDGTCLAQDSPPAISYVKLRSMPKEEYGKAEISFRKTKWQHSAVMEFLTSVSLRWVHKIEQVMNPEQAALRLIQLDHYLCKDWEKHLLHMTRTRPFTMRREKNVGQYILSSFPGIGMKRAADILTFNQGQIPLRWTVTPDELCEVPGIGPKTVQKAFEALENKKEKVNQ